MKTVEPMYRDVTTLTSKPKGKTVRQIAADQKKVAHMLARETRQNESDDRFLT